MVFMTIKKCVLDDINCLDCGFCDICDLDPEKICNNCEKCLDSGDYNGIEIEKVIIKN